VHVSTVCAWFHEWRKPQEKRKRNYTDCFKRLPEGVKNRTLELLGKGLDVSAAIRRLESETKAGGRIPARWTIFLWAREAGISPPCSPRGRRNRKPTAADRPRSAGVPPVVSAEPIEDEDPEDEEYRQDAGATEIEEEDPRPGPYLEGEGEDVGAAGGRPEEGRMPCAPTEATDEAADLPEGWHPCLRENIPQISLKSCLEWQARWRAPGTDPHKAWEKMKLCRSCGRWAPRLQDLPIRHDPSMPETMPRDAIAAM